MDEQAQELKMVVAAAQSVFVSSGRERMTLKEFACEYLQTECESVPYGKFNHQDLASFLQKEAGMVVSGATLFYKSDKCGHISNLIAGQKTKPKSLAGRGGRSVPKVSSWSVPQRPPPPPPLKTSGASNLLPSDTANASVRPRTELEVLCDRLYPSTFRYELRLKLQACPNGVTPSEFVDYFNRSNFEKFKVSKDLDFKGLAMMEFFHGLTDVFRVETNYGVTKLYPALTKSPSSHKIGAPQPTPRQRFNVPVSSPVESLPMADAAPGKSLPTVNEVINMLKRVNEFYAGKQVSMTEYRSKICEIGGSRAQSWLKVKNFSREMLCDFVIDNSAGFSIEAAANGDAVVISNPAPECAPQPIVREAGPNERTAKYALDYEPYTTLIRMKPLVFDGQAVDVQVNEFATTALQLYFSPVEMLPARKQLMARLLAQYSETRDDQLSEAALETGMVCVAPYEPDEPSLYRVVILRVDGHRAKVYYVDFGMEDSVEVKELRRITDEFLEDSAYACSGVIVNAYPAAGRESFTYKTLQDIKLELEFQVMKARFVRLCEKSHKYELNITDALLPLHQKGWLSFEKPSPHAAAAATTATLAGHSTSNGYDGLTNGHANYVEDLSDVTFQRQILPNCETIVVVRFGSTAFVTSSDISRLLGLQKDTFLSSLEESNILVVGSWKPSSQMLEQLKAYDCTMLPGPAPILIPVRAAAPLMRAYTFLHSTPLLNEKNVLKFFTQLAK